MSPVGILQVVVSVMIALGTTAVLIKVLPTSEHDGRFKSIDGLRGFLAFFVFVHHSTIWYFYLRTGDWREPPSNLYIHLGQTSVALFFMITAFLFISKLINVQGGLINWGQLFISRVMRIVPLYVFAMVCMFLVVFKLSDFHINVPIYQLVKQMLSWLGFIYFGAFDVNGIEHTAIITAGVVWSLPYEWFFYLLLPVIGLCMGIKVPRGYLLLSLLGLLLLLVWRPKAYHLFTFVGGWIAAKLVQNDNFSQFSKSKYASWIVCLCMTTIIYFHSSTHTTVPILLLTLVFSLIAGGNDIFGILSWRVSRAMGEWAYSIYLLHGLILFAFFNFVVGFHDASQVNVQLHWMWIFALVPVLIITSAITYNLIERPFMSSTSDVYRWLTLRIKSK